MSIAEKYINMADMFRQQAKAFSGEFTPKAWVAEIKYSADRLAEAAERGDIKCCLIEQERALRAITNAHKDCADYYAHQAEATRSELQ